MFDFLHAAAPLSYFLRFWLQNIFVVILVTTVLKVMLLLISILVRLTVFSSLKKINFIFDCVSLGFSLLVNLYSVLK